MAEPKESHAFALVVTDLVNPYYTALCAGAEQEAARLGYTLQVYTTTSGRQQVLNSLLERRADGVILVGGFIEDSDASLPPAQQQETRQTIREMMQKLKQTMPLVTIGPVIEGFSCVNITSDLSLSIRKSINHLVALGHRRISFIGGSASVRSATIR